MGLVAHLAPGRRGVGPRAIRPWWLVGQERVGIDLQPPAEHEPEVALGFPGGERVARHRTEHQVDHNLVDPGRVAGRHLLAPDASPR